MFGLAVLVVGVIYLIVLLAATIGAYFWAARRGFSRAKCWLAAAGGFLVIYLPVFWDHVPTVVAHQYYCAKEAGFWEYKSVEQWKKENPGVMETLIAKTITVADEREGTDEDNWKSTYKLNQRIYWTNSHAGPLPLYRWRTESTLVDAQASTVLVRAVDFYTAQQRAGGGWRGWKFWLAMDHCSVHFQASRNFGVYLESIKGISK